MRFNGQLASQLRRFRNHISPARMVGYLWSTRVASDWLASTQNSRETPKYAGYSRVVAIEKITCHNSTGKNRVHITESRFSVTKTGDLETTVTSFSCSQQSQVSRERSDATGVKRMQSHKITRNLGFLPPLLRSPHHMEETRQECKGSYYS